MAKSDSEEKFEVRDFDIPVEVSNYIEELLIDYKAVLRKFSKLKKKNSRLRQWESFQKEKIEHLEKDLLQTKENHDFVLKENDFLKKEILNFTKRFSIGLKTLEHILSIQIPYYNKSRLGFKNKMILENDFPTHKEGKKQKPHRVFYENHFRI